MTVKDVAQELGAEIICEGNNVSRHVNGCYIGDLLSCVMSKSIQDNIWITIMSNLNILAVASLADVACVLLGEGVNPDEELVNTAKQKGINILTSEKTSFELAKLIGALI